MSDLHTALEAAITARLEVARAATPGPWAPDKPWLSDVVNSALLGPVADCSIGTGYRAQSLEDARHIALHDPDDSIRRYERDLKALKRHAELPNSWGSCTHCRTSSTDRRNEVLLADWPCVDFLDLLDVYPEVTRP